MNTIDYGLLGRKIRDARKKMGLTQAELGDREGVSDSHISHIENCLLIRGCRQKK